VARSISLMKIFCLLLCQSQHAGLLDFSPIATSRQKPPRKGLATLRPAPSPNAPSPPKGMDFNGPSF